MTTPLLDLQRVRLSDRAGEVAPTGSAGPGPGPGPVGRPRRRDLEGLRALAVLGVVVFHLRASWLPGGFAGVDVFFVLSGFFITTQLVDESERRGGVDLRAFWGRRARRLLPASALVTVTTLVASAVVVDVLHEASVARDALFTGVFALNWRLADEGTSYFTDPAPSPFVHYWSLGVEEQFYAVWPVLVAVVALCLGRRSRRAAVRQTLLVIVAVASVGSFGAAVAQTYGTAQPYAYFATYARVWQLGLGAALALGAAGVARAPSAWRAPVRFLGVAGVVAFYVAAPNGLTYPGWWAVAPTVGAAAVVAAGIGEGPRADDPLRRLLGTGPAQVLGRYSYGWYLWHWPPLVLLPYALGHPLHTYGLVACGLGTLALAAATYHLLEHPVRTSSRLAARRGRRSLLLGAALVALVCTAGAGALALADHRAAVTAVRAADGGRLDPQPAVAAAELPQPSRDGCEVGLSSPQLSGECRYLPATGRGDIVLVGDSHAAQWFPAVRTVAARHHWGLRVWTRASCPLAEVTKMLHGVPARDCNRWRADVMARLVAARPSLVIVGGYASVVPSLYDPATGRLVGGRAARSLYEAGLRRQFKRLRAAAIRVLLIRDNPSFDVGGPQCVLAHDGRTDACSARRQHALRTAADLHAARAVPGVGVLDLTPVFCPAERCHEVLGSTLAYRDTNHLTLEMVRRLTGRLDAAALAVARGPR